MRAAVGLGVLLVLLAVIAGVGAWYLLRPQPAEIAGEPGTPVHVVIEAGSTTSDIAALLEDLGVIDSAFSFRLKTKAAEADGKLRAGEYDMTTGMSYEDAIAMLKRGPVLTYYTVPIPEGFTAEQIAARFAERAHIPAEELLALMTTGAEQFAADHPYLAGAYGGSLEGFLFPATYEVEEGTTATEVVELMLDTFDENVAKLDLAYAAGRDLDLKDVVIIASILEREAQLSEEFPLVSSVIYNRLAKPMRLQLCATVMYTMPDGTTSLTNDDLEQDSPYNTYLHDGLPVGPISNPGLAALTAASAPAETDYLYYVLTGKDGSQTFCATYDEFLRAKQKNKEVFSD